jgi:peptidoglycan/LPS O-acetylase OafA/YrhL
MRKYLGHLSPPQNLRSAVCSEARGRAVRDKGGGRDRNSFEPMSSNADGSEASPVARSAARGLAHNKALDGIRGIAIIDVMLFHYTWLSVGWAGVQIFFVLSGFLITSILFADQRLPLGTYLKRFYWRRCLRIFPLYFGYLALVSVAFAAAGVPAAFRNQWPYLFSYTFNFDFLLRDRNYSQVLGHLWSLSVEEQFYLVWPVLVYMLPRRAFQWLLLGLIALSPGARALAAVLLRAGHYDIGLGGLTFCQLDAFAIGASVATFGQQLARRPIGLFVACCAILLAAGQLNAIVATGSPVFDTSFGYPGNLQTTGHNGQYIWGYSLLNIWAASLVAVALRSNWVSAVLSTPVLAHIGKVSYGMYIAHVFIQLQIHAVFGVRHGLENVGEFIVYFCTVVAVATLSYRWYETPFLRLKDKYFRLAHVGVTAG